MCVNPGLIVCTRMPRAASSADTFREKASWACFAAVYGPLGPPATAPATETTLTTLDGTAGLEQGEEGTHTPDAAEEVDAYDLLDPLRLELEEAPPAGNARVVDEQVHLRVALADAFGQVVYRETIADVADLCLAVHLARDVLEPFPAAGDEHAAEGATGQLARQRSADAARGAGDHRDLHANVRTVLRLIATVSSIRSA